MANIKSAMKRVKVSKRQNLRNRMVMSSTKTAIKRFDAALVAGDKEEIERRFRIAVSTVDKAAAKGIIHKNLANRKKAQLAVKLAAK